MDFFGKIGGGEKDTTGAEELRTPIGILVRDSTAKTLSAPDWALNLDICDRIAQYKDGTEQVLRAIQRRLKDSNTSTVYLTLIVMETCIKNCGSNFARHVDKVLMNDIVSISKTQYLGPNKPSDEALRLIQQWGKAFASKRQTLPIFYDVYNNLKSRGVVFPKDDEPSPMIFEGDKQNSSPSASKAASAVPLTNEEEFSKLHNDLMAVMEKVRMCREMLQFSPGIETDELLADVVGYLEACRDRLSDVIDSGTHGMLGEDLFAQCLKVNDAVIRTLDAERTGTKIAVDEESGDAKNTAEEKEDLLDLDSVSLKGSAPTQLIVTEEDIFGSLELQTISKADTADPAGYPNPPSTLIPISAAVFPPPSVAAAPIAAAPMTAHAFAAPVYGSKEVVLTPTPFDNLPAVPSAAPEVPNVKGSSEDDFDAFFENLGKKE